MLQAIKSIYIRWFETGDILTCEKDSRDEKNTVVYIDLSTYTRLRKL
jgi:hypothetical protein